MTSVAFHQLRPEPRTKSRLLWSACHWANTLSVIRVAGETVEKRVYTRTILAGRPGSVRQTLVTAFCSYFGPGLSANPDSSPEIICSAVLVPCNHGCPPRNDSSKVTFIVLADARAVLRISHIAEDCSLSKKPPLNLQGRCGNEASAQRTAVDLLHASTGSRRRAHHVAPTATGLEHHLQESFQNSGLVYRKAHHCVRVRNIVPFLVENADETNKLLRI